MFEKDIGGKFSANVFCHSFRVKNEFNLSIKAGFIFSMWLVSLDNCLIPTIWKYPMSASNVYLGDQIDKEAHLPVKNRKGWRRNWDPQGYKAWSSVVGNTRCLNIFFHFGMEGINARKRNGAWKNMPVSDPAAYDVGVVMFMLSSRMENQMGWINGNFELNSNSRKR
jgi:hypothetical protein